MSRVRIKSVRQEADTGAVDQADSVVLLVPDDTRNISWSNIPYGSIIAKRWARSDRETTSQSSPWFTNLPNEHGSRLAIGTVAAEIQPFAMLSLGRKLLARVLKPDTVTLAVLFGGLPQDLEQFSAQALIAAALARHEPLPSYKSRPVPAAQTLRIILYGTNKPIDFARTRAEAEGNNLARKLTAMPANELTPASYRKHLQKLAAKEGWKTRFFTPRALEQKKAGAFLAVARGDPQAGAGLLQLCYRPSPSVRRPRLALVGKGICFDSGGTNLKSARHMYGMHEDMAGSATAAGTLLSLSRLRVPFAVDCWLALARNQIGPDAYKQNEVVTACNGTTIEVVHTDAEGRMVLADTLSLASRTRPSLVIDYATLTGACIEALGNTYSGVFTNREPLLPVLMEAGRKSGERVWPFPQDSDYDSELESDIADIKQCTLDNKADHILAARFLSRFVSPDIPWVHIDLAAARHKGGLAHIPTNVTGFGIRFTLQFLSQYGLLN